MKVAAGTSADPPFVESLGIRGGGQRRRRVQVGRLPGCAGGVEAAGVGGCSSFP